MKTTTYMLGQTEIKANDLPEIICFETYNADDRPEEAFDVSVTYKLNNGQYRIQSIYYREAFDDLDEKDRAVLRYFALTDSQKLISKLFESGELTDGEELTSSTDDQYLDGRLLTDGVEIEEVEALKSSAGCVQDGDFFVLSGGFAVLDCACYSDNDVLIYTVDEYTTESNDICNISHCTGDIYSDLVQVQLHQFTDRHKALEFIFDRIKNQSSSLE